MLLVCWLASYHSSKLRETELRGWYVGGVMETLWKCSTIRNTVLMALNNPWEKNEGITEQGLLGI